MQFWVEGYTFIFIIYFVGVFTFRRKILLLSVSTVSVF